MIGASKRYGPNILFENLNLTLSTGKAVRVAGPNGSGKTQLLYALCGLVPLDLGKVITDATENSTLGRSAYSRDKVCRFIPASPSRLAFLSVAEFVDVTSRSLQPLSLRSRDSAAQEAFSRLRRPLEEATGRTLLPEMKVSSLSIGQQKRLQFASVVYSERSPVALAVDEPLAALDADGIKAILRLLQSVRDRGTALAIAEHRPEIDAIRFDETIAMPYGIAIGLDPSMLLPREATAPPQSAPVVCLTLKGVDVGYPGALIHCDDFRLDRGAVAILSAGNGAGKTGLLKGLLGIPPAVVSGALQLFHAETRDLSVAMQRGEVRYMAQTRDSFRSHSVQDALLSASLPVRTPDPILQSAIEWIGGRKKVDTLSSGNLALLCLAQTLARRPLLALLDEPFANVDARNARKMADMIAHARRDFGTAFLIVEHGNIDLPESDRYTVRHDGNRAELRRYE